MASYENLLLRDLSRVSGLDVMLAEFSLKLSTLYFDNLDVNMLSISELVLNFAPLNLIIS